MPDRSLKLIILMTLLLITALFNTQLIAEIKSAIEGEHLVINHKNKEYKIPVTGNSVMNQFIKGGTAYFEVHINPSHSELVIFNLKTEKSDTYLYTRYFMNKKMDILTIVDPPHFSSDGPGIEREISVNGIPVCRINETAELDVRVSGGRFLLYSGKIKIGSITGNKKDWVYTEYTNK